MSELSAQPGYQQGQQKTKGGRDQSLPAPAHPSTSTFAAVTGEREAPRSGQVGVNSLSHFGEKVWGDGTGWPVMRVKYHVKKKEIQSPA